MPAAPSPSRATAAPRPIRRWDELEFFLDRGIVRPDLRNDAELEQVHWATNRGREHGGDWSEMRVFAFDHRVQLEEMEGCTPERVGAFKELCLKRRCEVQDGQPGYGILCDNRIGRAALHAASGTGLWIGRPCEWPGSRPLTLEPELGSDYGGLGEWARENVVKVLCFCHPDDDGGDARRCRRRRSSGFRQPRGATGSSSCSRSSRRRSARSTTRRPRR